MRWWLLAWGASVVIVVAVIVLSATRRTHPPSAPPTTTTPVAAAPCPAVTVPSLRPPETSGFFVRGAAREVRLDGRPWRGGARIPSGDHRIQVAGGVDLLLRFEPFTTTLLELKDDPAGVVPLLVGHCGGCDAPGPVDLAWVPGDGQLDEAAHALQTGRWTVAVGQLKHVPLAHRAEPRVAALLASVAGFADAAVGVPLLQSMVQARKDRQADEVAARLAWSLAWWNAVTDRFGRLTRAAADQAPRAVEATRARLEQLSTDFNNADLARDADRQADLSLAAERMTSALVGELVAGAPRECGWHARLAAALER